MSPSGSVTKNSKYFQYDLFGRKIQKKEILQCLGSQITVPVKYHMMLWFFLTLFQLALTVTWKLNFH